MTEQQSTFNNKQLTVLFLQFNFQLLCKTQTQLIVHAVQANAFQL